MFNNQLASKRIRDRRIELGLTLEKFAEILVLSASYTGMVERGVRFVSMNNLIKISDILAISTDYILKGTGGEKPIETSNQKLIHLSETVLNEYEANLFIQLFIILTREQCTPEEYKNICALVFAYITYRKENR